MQLASSRPARIAFTSIGALGLIGSLAACSSAADAQTDGTATSESSSSATSTTPSDTTDSGAAIDTSSSTYADGDYTEEGSYQSPGGGESITVKITLANDVVTAVTVTPEATSGDAKRYQTAFAGAISGEVVGKSLDDISVSKVAGSSLTSTGFKEALEAIKADASA